MNTQVLIVLVAALLTGCGERVDSPAHEAVAPVITTAAVKREAPFVPGKSPPASTDEPAARPTPDYKDSSGRLDTSR